MKMKNKGKRGFTLTELVVVIAVLAIISTMVVSFSVMVNGSQRLAKAKVEALGDIRLAESVIEGFIVDKANEEKAFSASDDGKSLKIDDTEKIVYTGSALEVYRGSDGKTTHTFEHITKIEFNTHGSTDIIYYCKITYTVGDHEYDYTFCVNPYAGETINPTQGEGT